MTQNSCRTVFKRIISNGLNEWLPRHCALCEIRLTGPASPNWLAPPNDPAQTDPQALGLCAGCRHSLPGLNAPRCLRCGLVDRACPAPSGAANLTPCADALAAAELDAIVVAGDYARPLDRWITAMKYGGNPALAQWLGALLADSARRAPIARSIEWLIAVPPARERLVERGFDHTAALARPVARALNRPLQRGQLSRDRHTPRQAGLKRAARQASLSGAFTAAPQVAARVIGLVDDVMTSGATLQAAARALRAAGAAQIIALVVARTPTETRAAQQAPIA